MYDFLIYSYMCVFVYGLIRGYICVYIYMYLSYIMEILVCILVLQYLVNCVDWRKLCKSQNANLNDYNNNF